MSLRDFFRTYVGCKHGVKRCIHGDEILLTLKAWSGDIRRSRCVTCGKTFEPMPEVCSFTGQRHGANLYLFYDILPPQIDYFEKPR
jgi:hypothetical protein